MLKRLFRAKKQIYRKHLQCINVASLVNHLEKKQRFLKDVNTENSTRIIRERKTGRHRSYFLTLDGSTGCHDTDGTYYIYLMKIF